MEPPCCWPNHQLGPTQKLLSWEQRRILVMIIIISKMKTSNNNNYREPLLKPYCAHYTRALFFLTQPPHKIGLPVCILQMEKVRPREVRQCAQHHTANGGKKPRRLPSLLLALPLPFSPTLNPGTEEWSRTLTWRCTTLACLRMAMMSPTTVTPNSFMISLLRSNSMLFWILQGRVSNKATGGPGCHPPSLPSPSSALFPWRPYLLSTNITA